MEKQVDVSGGRNAWRSCSELRGWFTKIFFEASSKCQAATCCNLISQSMSELQKMGASPCIPFQDCKIACNVGRYQFGAEPRNRRTWQKSLTEFGFDGANNSCMQHQFHINIIWSKFGLFKIWSRTSIWLRSVHLDCGFVRSTVPLDHMSPLRHEVYQIGTVTAPRPSLGLRAAKPQTAGRWASALPASLNLTTSHQFLMRRRRDRRDRYILIFVDQCWPCS